MLVKMGRCERRYRGGTADVVVKMGRWERRYRGGTVHPHKNCYIWRGGPATPFALYKIKKHSGVGGGKGWWVPLGLNIVVKLCFQMGSGLHYAEGNYAGDYSPHANGAISIKSTRRMSNLNVKKLPVPVCSLCFSYCPQASQQSTVRNWSTTCGSLNDQRGWQGAKLGGFAFVLVCSDLRLI